MLGKNNFKERLRKMEEQNKRERFSIRKLSIGAASVLIGFAFMGLSSSSVLADPLVPASESQTAKSKTNNQGNDAAAEKPQLVDSGKQNNDQTSMDAQSGKQESQVPTATEQKQNEQSAQPDQAEKVQKQAEQIKQDQAVPAQKPAAAPKASENQSTVSKPKTDTPENKPAKNQLAEPVKNNAVQAPAKADQDKSQLKTGQNLNDPLKQAGAATDQAASPATDQANQSKKPKTLAEAVTSLQQAMDQASDYEEKIEANKSLTDVQKKQLAQIDDVMMSGQALLDKYNAKKMEGQTIAGILRSNPENSDNRGHGNGLQGFDLSQFGDLAGQLGGLLNNFGVIPGNGGLDSSWGTLNTDNWTTQVDGGYLKITGYTGAGGNVIVPNGADFAQAGQNPGNLETEIDGSVTQRLAASTIAFSKTNGQKTKFVGNGDEAFARNGALTRFDGSGLDVSGVTNFNGMFQNDEKLTDLSSLSNWDVSHGTTFGAMFNNDSSLTNINSLSHWDVSNGRDFDNMFSNDTNLSDISGLSHWDVSNGRSFNGMFLNNNLSNLSVLSSWNVSNGEDFNNMFSYNTNLSDISGLSRWNVSNGINFGGMFMGDTSLSDLSGLSNWKTSNGTNFNGMFRDDTSLSDLSELNHWDVSKGADFSIMFMGDTNLSDLSGLNHWDVSNGTNFDGMFSGNSSLSDLSGLSQWDVSNGTNFHDMFSGNSSLSDLSGLSNWKVSNGTNFGGMFYNDGSLSDLSGLSSWKVSNGTNFHDMFNNDSNLRDLSGLSNWKVSNGTDFGGMFNSDSNLSDVSALSNWDVSNGTNFHDMFNNDSNLRDLSGLSNWKVSNGTNFGGMFMGDTSLSDLSELGRWDVSKGTDFSVMFASDPIKWADFSKWNLRRLSQNSSGLDGIITNSGATIYLGSNTNLPSWFLNSTNNNVFTASTSPAHTVIITSNSTLLNEYHSASNAAHNQLTFQGSPINMDKFIDISKAIPDSSVPGGQLAYNDTTLNRNHIIAYCRQLLKNEIDEKQRELGDSYVVLSSGLKSNDPIEILNATLITDTITVANDNTVTAHANATSADPASGQITIKDDHNNAVTGWTFSGWSTKSGNTYSDITSRDLATDLNDSNLDSHGLHDINDVYAKITLADGSVIHTPAMKIQVLGGVGQANTYMHTTTAPQASVGVKNYTAVHNEFSGATYSWVENTGTDSAPTWTDFNDFNTRTQDREGNLAANDKVYVKIAWGDGTYQYVKAPVTIKNATDEIAALTGLKGKALTVHVVNDGTMPAYLDDNTEFTYTDRAGNPQTKKLSEINSAAALAWSTAAGAAVPNFKLASGQADYDAVITVRGESTSVKVKIPVTIIGASAKTTIPTIDSMHSLTEAETKNDLDLPSGYSFDATDPNKKITASWIYATANRDGSFTTHALDNTHQIDTKWSSTHTAAAAWIKVQFGNDASHCQIVHVSIPLRSSNAGINTALAAADTAIATHVGAPATNWTDSTGSTPATLGNARDYVHLTYGTGASATAVDLSNIGAAACPIASITWAAKPDTSAAADASANKKATIKITFTDGSRAKTVEVPYTVIGAKAKSDLETNHGTALTASDEISNLSALTTANFKVAASDVSWASDAPGAALASDFWTAASDSSTATDPVTGSVITGRKGAYLLVHYKKADGRTADGTQAIWVAVKVKSDADNIDPSTGITVANGNTVTTHVNAASLDPTSSITVKDKNNATVSDWTFAGWATKDSLGHYHDEAATAVATDLDATGLNTTTGTKNVTGRYAKIKLADDSIVYTPEITMHVVGGYAVADSDATTLDRGEDLTTTAAKTAAENMISNHSDLDTYYATYAWSTTDGPDVSASSAGTVKHAKVVISYFKDAAHTEADGTQTVTVPYKVQDDTEANAPTVNSDGLTVHYGQEVTVDDAIGLIKIGSATTYLTPSDVGTGHTVTGVQWTKADGTVITPNTEQATADQGNTDVPSYIKVNYADGSSKVVAATIHVHAGYNNADKSYTLVSGTLPTVDDARNAIKNSAAGTTDSLAGYNPSYSWAQDSTGTAMSSSYVTSSTSTNKDAWVVITYTDGTRTATQIVKVNALTINSQADSYTVNEVTGGLKSHAVDSGEPDYGHLKDYFTVTGGPTGTTDESSHVTSIDWKGASYEPVWTTAGDKTGIVTVTFDDNSTKDVTLDVHLVGAKVPDTTESAYRNVVPTDTEAKGKVTNAVSDLDQYHATYGWYSNAAATTALTSADVATATAAGSPKTVYLGVKYYKDSAHTQADGQQVITIQLTINNSSSQYTASLKDTSTAINTHVNAPSTDFTNWSNWITVKKTSDSSTIDLSTIGTASNPIRSIEWTTAPNTAESADSSQTAIAKITFEDSTDSELDFLTVDVPVSVVKATAKSDIETNHDSPLTAKDEISNLTDLNPATGEFKVGDSDVAWASDASGTALASDFWTTDSDNSTATDPTTGIAISGKKGAYLIVHYKKNDGTPDGNQAIWVAVKVKSDADNVGNVTFDTVHGNTIKTHANATSAAPASGQITIKDDHNNDVTGWTFSGWSTKSGNTYSDISAADLANDLNDSNLDTATGTKDVNDVYAKITLADGSVIHTPVMKIHVLGGVGQAKTYMHTTTAPNASDGVKNYTAVHDAFSDATYSWVETTGTVSSPTWTAFTDFNTRTQDSSGNLAANDKIYVKITWGDGTYQYVKAPLTIKSDADNINPDTGVTFDTAHGNTVKTHANAASADPASGQITVKDSNGNTVTSWTFAGWSTKAGNSYSDISATALTNDLKDSNLNSDGVHDIDNVYAKIKLADNSVIHTPAMKIHVLGGVGQAQTYTARKPTDPAPAASDGVKNYTAMHDAFGGAAYKWVEYTGSGTPTHGAAGLSNWTNFTDRTTDAQGNLVANNNIYVEIKYSDGTYQYVKAPLTIQRASDLYGSHVTVNSNGITTHVNAPAADYAPSNGQGFTETGIPSNVTVTYAWNSTPDVTDSNLNSQGKKDETKSVKLTFTDTSTGLSSAISKEVVVHVIGGVAASEHQSVQQGDLPSVEQAQAAIGNNAALAPYHAGYSWYLQKNGAALTTADTALPAGTNSGTKQVWVKISYQKADGTADGEQWVQTTLNLTNSLSRQFHDQLSSNAVTVVKGTVLSGTLTNGSVENAVVQDPRSGYYHQGTFRVVNTPTGFPSDAVFSWASPVDTSSVGNVSTRIKVTYSDRSTDYIPAVVNVIDHLPTMAESTTPTGGEIWVAPNTQLTPTSDPGHYAEQGITNHGNMPAGTKYTWQASVDTSQPGSRLAGIVKVSYSDGSFNTAGGSYMLTVRQATRTSQRCLAMPQDTLHKGKT